MTRSAQLEPFTRAQRLAIRRAERKDARLARVHRSFRRATSVVVAVFAGFVGMTSASAFFSAHGSGSAVGSVATVKALSTAASGVVSTKLIPNNASADLVMQVTNLNGYPVTITGISQPASPPVGVSGGTGCTITGVSVPTQSLSIAITAVNGASQTVHIGNGAKMDATSQSGCQNATFTIPVSLTVTAP